MTESSLRRGLVNDTAINVVGLLQSEIGDHRDFTLSVEAMPLGDDLIARRVSGDVRLTRLRDRILAQVTASAEVALECVRCLRPYPRPVRTELTEEFWQSVDVRTGVPVDQAEAIDDEEERFSIDENHELDLREVLRQHLVLALPMKPDCGSECPGPPGVVDDEDGVLDERFAALADLLARSTDRT
jgi:uncharacterized protein